MESADPGEVSDERFLDGLLDRVLRTWGEGGDVSVDDLARERPDLRPEIARVVAEAREIAILRPSSLPTVPGYRIERELGRGGMAVVYLAHQESVDRQVALKLLPAASLLSERSRRRFLTEARSLGRVRHPNVVAIYEVIERDEFCAFALEWVRGRSLDRSIAERELDPDFTAFVCRTGVSIGRALQAVHERGLVHRDVKPSNILLREDGTALLADFGLVRAEDGEHVTRTGEFVGTTAFASPEQLRGEHERVDARTDVFALGASLFTALAGEPPYAGTTAAAVLRSASLGVLRPMSRHDVSQDLLAVLEKALAPEPERRYATAAEFADDLERVLTLRPVQARRAGPLTRASRLARRNARTILTSTLTALVVLAITVFLVVRAWGARTLPERVDEAFRRAHLALLEPYHAQRIQYMRNGVQRPSYELPDQVARALEHYDAVLALDPTHAQARLERELLLLAAALTGGVPRAPPAFLRAGFPGTTAAFEALTLGPHEPTPEALAAIAAEDRRALGLLAFLAGDIDLCHAAWLGLDLRSGSAADPLIDAATGQMLHELERPTAALPRLVRSFDRFPEAGFLATAIADCACRMGEVDAAEHYLAFAEREPRDPWMRHVRVRADVLAARGRDAEARAAYEEHLRLGGAPSTRRRFATFLESRGEVADAIDLLVWIAEIGEAGAEPRDALVRLARDRWSSYSAEERIDTVAEGLGQPARTWLTRVARVIGEQAESIFGPNVSQLLAAHDATRGLQEAPLEARVSLARSALRTDPGASPDDMVRRLRAAEKELEERRARTGPSPWHELGPAPPGFVSDGFPAFGRDPARGEWVLFGGRDPATLEALADTWTFDGERWERHDCDPSPPARYDGTLLFDSERGVLLLTAGQSVTAPTDDTWAWDGASWTELVEDGDWGRAKVFAFDSRRGLAVGFGGVAAEGTRNDTLEWDGVRWSERAAGVSPRVRSGHAMAFDAARGKTLLFGGNDGFRALDETWTWDGESWLQESPASRPAPRGGSAMAYDPGIRRVVLHGGEFFGAGLDDTWEWDGETWRQTSFGGRAPVGSGRMVFDEKRRVIVLFDGRAFWAYRPPGASGAEGNPRR